MGNHLTPADAQHAHECSGDSRTGGCIVPTVRLHRWTRLDATRAAEIARPPRCAFLHRRGLVRASSGPRRGLVGCNVYGISSLPHALPSPRRDPVCHGRAEAPSPPSAALTAFGTLLLTLLTTLTYRRALAVGGASRDRDRRDTERAPGTGRSRGRSKYSSLTSNEVAS
jgi:hypothetical protein